MRQSGKLKLEDLMEMSGAQLHRVMEEGTSPDEKLLEGQLFLGVDLSLPPLANRILWKTFAKTFWRDPESPELRGWNIRVEQRGVGGEMVPLVGGDGHPRTFGHYRLRSARGMRFPRGWRGAACLDYGAGGNRWWDLARFGLTPIVAVNRGESDLLLGWEVLRVAGGLVALPDYWALCRVGPVKETVSPPMAVGPG